MQKKKRDYLIYTMAFQFAICIILFGVLYALKQTNANLFYEIKNEVFSQTHKNFDFVIIKEDEKPKDKLDKEETDKTASNTEAQASGQSEKSVEKAEFLSASISPAKEPENVPDNVCVSFYTLNEKIVSPVKKGRITSEFGERVHPISNEEKFHAGIDIGADSGTPIYASFSGVCTVADYDDWNGYYIKLQHEGNIMTVYCHCSKLNIKKGDKVKAGDVIAYVGSTGSSTGPHLHYEIRVDNVSLNPEFALNGTTDAV